MVTSTVALPPRRTKGFGGFVFIHHSKRVSSKTKINSVECRPGISLTIGSLNWHQLPRKDTPVSKIIATISVVLALCANASADTRVRYQKKDLEENRHVAFVCERHTGGKWNPYRVIATNCSGRLIHEKRGSIDGTVFITLAESTFFNVVVYKTNIFALKSGETTTGELRAQFAGDSHMSPVQINVAASEEGNLFVLTYRQENETMRRITRVEYSKLELAQGLRTKIRSTDTLVDKRAGDEKEIYSIEERRVYTTKRKK